MSNGLFTKWTSWLTHGLSDIVSTIHPYPTYSTGVQLLATEMSVEHALAGLSGKVLRAASQFTR